MWRQLNAEFAPKVNTRKLGMLSSILVLSIAQDQNTDVWRDHFQKWQTEVDSYDEIAGIALDLAIKVAVVVRSSPHELRTWLQLQADDYEGNYVKLQGLTMSFLGTRRSFADDGTRPMEVDALMKGKGKGKGKKGDNPKKGKEATEVCRTAAAAAAAAAEAA